MRGTAPSRNGDQSGATLVLVAFLLVFMLIIVAIVVDGGQGYADRRRAQNAADAAAMAGARAVGSIRFAGAGADLMTSVRAVASANGANADDLLSCEVVNPSLAVVAPCSPNGGWSTRADAAGVSVRAGIRRTTLFGAVAGRNELLVTTSAVATLQPLLTTRSPWMICGNPLLSGGYNLIDPATRTLRADTLLRGLYGAGGTALADGRGIPLQGTLPGTCGLSALWSGAVSPAAQPVRTGSYVTALNGTPSGPYPYDDILGQGGCPTGFVDGDVQSCNAVVPVFDETVTAANTARVVAWSVWTVRYSSAGPVKWWGTFVGAGTAAGGITSDGAVTGRSTYVVRIAG